MLVSQLLSWLNLDKSPSPIEQSALGHAVKKSTVHIPFERQFQAKNWSLSASAGDELQLKNQQVLYAASLKLGSQGTEVTVQLDTGSSDLWVDSSSFDTSDSSSWKSLNVPFDIGYGDGSSAQGTFGQDTVVVGQATVTGAQFAVATKDTTGGTFVFGVGLANGEAGATYDSSTGGYTNQYANIPQALKDQGVTESNSYSLWLDDWEASTGSILFGGVDHAQYTGKLALLPVIPTVEASETGTISPTVPDRLTVTLNGISLTNGKTGKSSDIITNANIPVLLDSGTTLSYLPNAWVAAVADSIGATYNSQYEAYIVPSGTTGSITYNFAGVEIEVPFDSFLRTLTLTDGSPATGSDGGELLSVGLLPSNSKADNTDGVHIDDGTIYILGDTFLCGAYVAFDLDNLEIGLAQGFTGSPSGTSIEAIGTSGIPSATQAPSYSSTSTNSEYDITTASKLFS